MVYVSSQTALSTAANTKSADQISGQYQFIGKGQLTMYALASDTGLKCTLKVNGVAIIDDEDMCMFGTSGTLSKINNELVSQSVAGGRVELFFRNTTGGALTVDYILEYTPTK
jgi:hypothetical protein